MKRLFFMLFVSVFLIVRYANSKIDKVISPERKKALDAIIRVRKKYILMEQKARNLSLLKYAQKGDNKKIVEMLRAGAHINTYDTNKQSQSYKQTPLMLATINGHGTSVRLLIQKGADINMQDSQGNTALHLAVIWNLPDAMYKLLIGQKASDTIANNAGKTVKDLIQERDAQKSKASSVIPTAEISLT